MQSYGSVYISDSAPVLEKSELGPTTKEGRVGQIGPQSECLVKIGDGILMSSKEELGSAATVIGEGIVRFQLDCLIVVSDSGEAITTLSSGIAPLDKFLGSARLATSGDNCTRAGNRNEPAPYFENSRQDRNGAKRVKRGVVGGVGFNMKH